MTSSSTSTVDMLSPEDVCSTVSDQEAIVLTYLSIQTQECIDVESTDGMLDLIYDKLEDFDKCEAFLKEETEEKWTVEDCRRLIKDHISDNLVNVAQCRDVKLPETVRIIAKVLYDSSSVS